MQRTVISALSVAAAVSVLVPAGQALSADWKLSGSLNYETGKYGTDTRTETFYLPVTLKRYFDKGELSLTIPYIRQRSTQAVTLIDGAVFKTKKAPSSVQTNDGPGDAVLKGSYYLLTGGKDPLDMSLVGKIKFPTADDKKGLGTGEFDETIGLEFGKKIMAGLSAFADLYYTFIGNPPGLDLQDRASFDVGLTDEINPWLTGSVAYEESTAIVKDTPHIRSVAFDLEYKASKELRLFTGASIGLTSASPDYGVSAGASLRF